MVEGAPRDGSHRRPALERWVLFCAAAVIHYVLVRAGQTFAAEPSLASPMWPAAGFALAATLLWGPSAAAGVFLGACLASERPFFASQVPAPASLLAAMIVAGAGESFQALLGAALLRRDGSAVDPSRKAADAGYFCVMAPLIALASPSFELLALALTHAPADFPWSRTFLTWWIGDVVGLLTIGPLVLAWARQGTRPPALRPYRAAEGAAAAALLVVSATLGFREPEFMKAADAPLLFITFPPMLWILFRFGCRSSTTAVAAISASVIWLTAKGGRFAFGPTVHDSLLIASAYLAALSVTSLLTRALLSEREAAMKELSSRNRSARERLEVSRKLFDSLPTGIAVLTLEENERAETLRIVALNPAGRVLSGAGDSQVEGTLLKEYSPEAFESGLASACLSVLRSGRSLVLRDFQSQRRVPGASFDLTVFALGEREVGIAFEDVTEQRRMRQVQQNQARLLERRAAELSRSNLELSQFAYVASHDLSAPLHKVKAFADRIMNRLGGDLDAEGSDYFRRMLRAIDGMQRLIDALLDLARVTTRGAEPVEVDLGEQAKDALEALDHEVARTRARVEIGRLPKITADPLQIRQLFQNLLSNALKFHKPGEAPNVRVRGKLTDDGRCEISVSDDGIGFDMKHADRIFQPFARLEGRFVYEGSGMGLAICQKIAARHGGTITATSEPGRGASFTVILPVTQEGRKQWREQEKTLS